MSILDGMSEEEKATYRQKKLEEVRRYNDEFIKDLNISRIDFNMKYKFTRDGVEYVGLFDNEFKRRNGFYFEIIDSNLEPSDPSRTIYRVPYNEFYMDEFEMDERSKWLVPLDSLRKVNRQSVAISKSSAITSSSKVLKDEDITPIVKPPLPVMQKYEDAPYSEMTIRDYITIHTGRPISNKAWLNELVKTK
jgi:hypothetical protein